MARKKPLTVGKGTSYTRPRADGKSPRPVSSKPSDASKKRAAQKTTSSGITRRPDGKMQPEGRASRSSISKAKVTSEAKTRSSGARGVFEKPNPKVTTGMGSKLARGAKVAKALKLAGPVGVAAAAMAPRRLGDATLRGKPTGNPQGPNVPKRLTKSSVDKGSFDNAFRMARKGGAKTFTWRGKKYNTKIKGEK